MMAVFTELSTLERNCCVRGYHVYHSIWDVMVGEEFLCECELANLHDRYVVAVIEGGNVIRWLFTAVMTLSDIDDAKAPLGSGSPP